MSPKSPAADTAEMVNTAAETEPIRSPSSKKKSGKVPKRIHKAERERMKRENLNELFISLANSLELSEANSGKASILGETIRNVKEMIARLQSLSKENTALLSEFNYVTSEAIELKDENCALQTQVEELNAEIKKRTPDSNLELNLAPSLNLNQESAPQLTNHHIGMPASELGFQQGQIINPVYLIPFCPDLHLNQEIDATLQPSKPTTVVSKPHPRYPTAGDKWPSELLEKHPKLGKNTPVEFTQ
ncbi:basic helix-loop-helix transcription factor [Lithospermum erythrorhizon]|uniref:Basic helix-loop-helix transcription factor n=1 Tax=Lithospermum erythrorhizon TaxID=34254 RepID=A0AAV3P0L2_LITER